jgi:hypothetical protein
VDGVFVNMDSTSEFGRYRRLAGPISKLVAARRPAHPTHGCSDRALV